MDKLKNAAELYWVVKGHIPEWLHESDDEDLDGIINNLTTRIWHNVEAQIHMTGFDEVWQKFNHK